MPPTPIGKGLDDVHADGRQPRRRRDARPPDRRRSRPPPRSASTLKAQFSGLGAGDDDQPVQGGAGRQADLHRDHGPSRAPTAFHDLVKQAVDQGIVVTDGNSPLTDLQNEFGTKGFGYAGVDLYAGGALTAQDMISAGNLKSGDEAMVYGVFSQAERGQSEKGLADTLEKAGLKVDRLEITQEVNSDTSLAVPVLAAYIQAHPNLKAIGTQHGGVTGILAGRAEEGRQEARRHRSSAASTSRRRRSTG